MSPRLKAPEIKLPAEYEAETQSQPVFMDRRRFLNYSGWVGVLGSLAVALLGFLRFLFPRVLFEPPTEQGQPYVAPAADFSTLERIEDGIYGSCVECDGRITKTRLNAIPYTPFCIKCASKLQGG